MPFDNFLRNWINRHKDINKKYKKYEDWAKKEGEKIKETDNGFFVGVDIQNLLNVNYSWPVNDYDVVMIEVSPGVWEKQ
jgi:hypothetical protein